MPLPAFLRIALAFSLSLSPALAAIPAPTAARQPARVFRTPEAERANAQARWPRSNVARDTEAQGFVFDGKPVTPEELLAIEALVGGPLNNHFADAIAIVTPAGDYPGPPVLGDNLDASKETGEPNHGGNAGGKSAWWKWTAPSNVRVSLYSVNSDFDTVLGVYTGSAVNALTAVPADPFTAPAPEAHFFPATTGTTYYIAVDGLDGRAGNITINLATLAATPPTIITQPADATVTAGRYFLAWNQVSAGGSPPLFHQWYHNDVAIPNAISPSLHILDIGTAQAGRYHVVVRNYWGSVTSNSATLSVNPAPPDPRPVITTQPANVSVTIGETATFRVTATGDGLLSYQWSFNGTVIHGSGSSSHFIPNVQNANAGNYTVTVTNAGGSVTSASAELRVFPAATKPVITGQPGSQTVTVGGTATFSVTASGYPDISYQWLHAGTPVANATAASLTLTNVQIANSGSYSVNVINALGTTPSANVTLTVTTPSQPSVPSGGGGGGGGAPSTWFLAALACLATARLLQRHQRSSVGRRGEARLVRRLRGFLRA